MSVKTVTLICKSMYTLYYRIVLYYMHMNKVVYAYETSILGHSFTTKYS